MKLLTVEQTARKLNVTEIHVRNLINSGQLPYINVGRGKQRRTIRVRREDLDKFTEVVKND